MDLYQEYAEKVIEVTSLANLVASNIIRTANLCSILPEDLFEKGDKETLTKVYQSLVDVGYTKEQLLLFLTFDEVKKLEESSGKEFVIAYPFIYQELINAIAQ